MVLIAGNGGTADIQDIIVLADDLKDTTIKYMRDFISIDWNIYSNGLYLDAPDLIKQKAYYTTIINKVPTVSGLPSYRESMIKLYKTNLLKEGITVLDDSIFGHSTLIKISMFKHETEGLLPLYVPPEPVIRDDPDSAEWIQDNLDKAWSDFLRDFVEPFEKWIIIIVIILIVGLILYVSIPLLMPLASGFLMEKGKQKAKKVTKL